jgi:hypothetical protein
MTTAEKIRSFSELPEAWHFSQLPPKNVVDSALRILSTCGAWYEQTDAFPYEDGSLMVTFYRNDWRIGVEIEASGAIGWYVAAEKGIGFDFKQVEDGDFEQEDAVVEFLKRYRDAL